MALSAIDTTKQFGLVETLVGKARVLCLVGAGGKKTTLYALARHLPGRVALSSTAHMAAYDASAVDEIVELGDPAPPVPWPSRGRVVAFAGQAESPQRCCGLRPAEIAQLLADSSFDHVLLKADGAKRRWIKAPADYEPLVPAGTERVLYFVSAQVIGAPLDERIAHRVPELAALCGMRVGDALTVEHLAILLGSERGALQGIGDCELVPVINMVDDARIATLAREVARRALARTSRYDRVVLANMRAATVVDVITRNTQGQV